MLIERSFLRSTFVFAAFAAVSSVLMLGGCAAKTSSDELYRELARLREEQRVMREELAELREAVDRRAGAVEIETEADQPAAATPPPREAIIALLHTYGEALEAEDVPRLREQVYGGNVPATDSRFFELWFGAADNMKVVIDAEAIEVDDDRATALVRQTMAFKLTRTSENRTVRLTLQMIFERSGSDWRLRHLSRR